MSKDKQSYDVGYRKPPEGTRFKKGTSGNPKGRPKGARGLKTDLLEELGSLVRVTENGQTKKYTKQQVVMKRLTEKAAKGDIRAIKTVVDAVLMIIGPDGEVAKSGLAVSASDQEIIKQALARMSPLPDDQQDRGKDNDDP